MAAVPISLRPQGDTRPDNQASMSLISLGTHLADPGKRLAHIRTASGAMKTTMGRRKSILPTDFPSLGVPWLIEAAAALYGRPAWPTACRRSPTSSSPTCPARRSRSIWQGARVRANCPTSIVVHGLALNITVQSFDEHMDFGLMADAAALPDVKTLAMAVDTALDELRGLPHSLPATPAAPAPLPSPPKCRASDPLPG